jgi:hypothetical protein
VADRLEVLGASDLRDGPGDTPLKAGGEGDVGYPAAARAQQVVVVLDQVLGQLEAGELVAGRDAANNPGSLQVDEMTVGGAARQVRKTAGDLTDTDRMTRAGQQADDRPPSGGVPLVDAAQPLLGQLVQITVVLQARHRLLQGQGTGMPASAGDGAGGRLIAD